MCRGSIPTTFPGRSLLLPFGHDSLCIGELRTPLPHDGVDNTHRLCQRGAEDDGLWLRQLEWNRGDAWNFGRVINAAFVFEPEAEHLENLLSQVWDICRDNNLSYKARVTACMSAIREKPDG